MKKIFTLCFSLISCLCAHAQTTIYSQTFNSGTAADWTLNTSDLSGFATSTDNQWIINNVYAGYGPGLCGTVAATANEPSGIAGFPNSYYMHIYSADGIALCMGTANCNFDAAGSRTYFAAMNSPIVTTGYTGVSFSFWWLCDGDAGAYGKVYYRTSGTGTWTAIPGGPATYYGSSAWAQQIVTNPAFDGQAFLEFGFQFTEDATGADPALAVDDILVTGISGAAPIPAFTVTPSYTACQDSSLTFTNTSTGGVDSFTWSIPGITISTPHTSPVTVPFTTAGIFTMTLTDYHGGAPYTATHTVTVIPTPHPVIHYTGAHTMSVTGAYTAYQWAVGSPLPTPITGATNATYTTTVTGTYYVGVDSAGCQGYSPVALLYSTTDLYMLGHTANTYWFSQNGSSGYITLHAADVLSNTVEVSVYDATGRALLRDTWLLGTNEKEINGADFAPGLYIIRLSNGNTSKVLKWMR